MKRCPSCQRTYDDAQGFCSVDATPLVSDPPPAYDPAKTVVAGAPTPTPPPPPSNEVPPTQVLSSGAPPNYQPYQPEQPPPYQQQQQWTPPPPQQQQWGAPPASRNNNKLIILALAGLLVAVGVGLAIYFLTRSSSSSGSSSGTDGSSSTSNTSPKSTTASDFVGTWKLEGEGDRIKINSDGTMYDVNPGGNPGRTFNYTIEGNALVIKAGGGMFKFTVESKNRLRAVETERGKEKPPIYWTRE